MPRVKRGNKRKEYRKKILKRASGYFLTKVQAVSGRRRGCRARTQVRLSRPSRKEAPIPFAVDCPHWCRSQAERHQLFTVDPRAKAGWY